MPFPSVTVTPATINLDLAQDPSFFTLSYENTTKDTLQFIFSAKDFTGLEEGWRIKFLSPEDAKNYHYSLSSWLKFSPSSMVLKPNETGKLTVDIRKEALSAGGHYASVVADITTPNPTSQTVDIKSQLISLAFVRAHTGFEREEAKVTSVTPLNGSLISLPSHYSLRFQNTGNTELTPHGLVIITDPLHHELTRGILNEDQLITLPETIRKYTIPLSSTKSLWRLPGLYHANLQVAYGANQRLTTQSTFFALGDPKNIAVAILLVLLVIIRLRNRSHKMKRRQHLIP